MAKAPKPNGCWNCRWIDKEGGSKRDGPWKCTFKVTLPPLPYSVMQYGDPEETLNRQIGSNGMWREDGVDCPTFQPEETPDAEK